MPDPIERLTRTPLLSAREEVALARRYRSGDLRAKDKFIEANMRLAIGIAGQFTRRGLELEDLVQIGSIGLIRAVEKFDPERGYKFSTYATWWIRKEIQRAISREGSTISITMKDAKRRRRIEELLEEKPGASDAEILAVLRRSDDKELRSTPASLIQRLPQSARVTSHLDARTSEGENNPYDRIPDPGSPDPAEMLFEDARVLTELERLPDLERRVIVLRYGFSEVETLTRDAVAERLGVDPREVKRAERRALRALRERLADLREDS